MFFVFRLDPNFFGETSFFIGREYPRGGYDLDQVRSIVLVEVA